LQRAAAVEQLKQVGKGVEVPVLEPEPGETVAALGARALAVARQRGHDVVIMDSAGRLHVDTALMDEIKHLADTIKPTEILFVADAMTGQDAVRSAGEFHKALSLTGVILSKMDGDARGGAALSIRHVTSVPIKFVGTGERPAEFEPFHPARLVGRLLGMGDILGLIEKAEEAIDVAEAQALEKKLRKSEFTLQDFRDQLRTLQKMGPLSGVLSMLPGMGPLKDANLDEGALKGILALVDSMTRAERSRPEILNGSRKKRVARGSGRSVQELNRLLKQFAQMRKMMKQVQAARASGRGFRMPFFGR
jgi:signal recognition particle subunit SRP54